MTSAEELTLDGKYREICDDLKLAGINWRDVCAKALTAAHEELVFVRAKEARKGYRVGLTSLDGFIDAVMRGVSRIEVFNPYVANCLLQKGAVSIDPKLSNTEFAEALKEYEVTINGGVSVVYAVHRLAPKWKTMRYSTLTFEDLEEVLGMRPNRFEITMKCSYQPLLHEAITQGVKISTPVLAARLHRVYAMALTTGGCCVGVLRALLDAPNAELGIVQATYPKETAAAMEAGAAFIITDDATWGSLLLHKVIRPVGESPTAAFLSKFRELYTIEPANNAGGVVCTRRA